jgi:hypothetical protein
MSDITFDKFHVHIDAKYYLPIIIEEVYNFRQCIRVTDAGMKLSAGDVLITSANSRMGSFKLFVTEVMYMEDLFEDFVLLDISPVTGQGSIWHVSDFVEIGDELKLLGNIF